MFRHVVLWRFEDEDDSARNREHAIQIKAGLEELVYEVHGVRKIDVHIDPVRSGDAGADMFMDSLFENRAAYLAFLESPRYVAMRKLLDSCVGERLDMDFEEDPEEGELPLD